MPTITAIYDVHTSEGSYEAEIELYDADNIREEIASVLETQENYTGGFFFTREDVYVSFMKLDYGSSHEEYFNEFIKDKSDKELCEIANMSDEEAFTYAVNETEGYTAYEVAVFDSEEDMNEYLFEDWLELTENSDNRWYIDEEAVLDSMLADISWEEDEETGLCFIFRG